MQKGTTPSDREWIEHWKRIAPQLDAIRRAELRNFKYEEHAAAIDALLQIGYERGMPRMTSGLVEFQRLLAKSRR
jgi:hypothetical protein